MRCIVLIPLPRKTHRGHGRWRLAAAHTLYYLVGPCQHDMGITCSNFSRSPQFRTPPREDVVSLRLSHLFDAGGDIVFQARPPSHRGCRNGIPVFYSSPYLI